MIIQQLSVFLENKSGRLNEILDILGHADILFKVHLDSKTI